MRPKRLKVEQLTARDPEFWPHAVAELGARDPLIAKLAAANRGLEARPRGDAFATLARAIVGQQISVRAADTIWARTVIAAGEAAAPQAIRDCADDILRSCGLSGRKVEYLKDLSRWFIEHDNGSELDHMSDERLIAELCTIKGVGRWTAEMFMIFYLFRPDVLPLDDLGLLRGVSLVYKGGAPVTKNDVRKLTAHWAPWRSVGTWYMWRALSPMPQQSAALVTQAKEGLNT